MAWGKGCSITSTSAGDTITTPTMTSSKFNQILSHTYADSSGINTKMRAGTGGSIDTGNNYATRFSANGATDDPSEVNLSRIHLSTRDKDQLNIVYSCNIADAEKLFIGFTCNQENISIDTAPDRTETVGKWVTTSGQYNVIQWVNTDSGDFPIGSNISVLGSDITPQAGRPTNVQDNSILVEKDTAKRYWFDDAFNLSELKAYYKFEEASGNIINQATSIGSTDSIGTNADGINNGSFAYQQAGKIDYGVALSDSSDYVELGTSLTQWQFMYAAGCKYTLTMWYKPSVTLDSGGFSTLFSNFGSANSEGVCISVDGQATTANRTRLYITSESNGTRYIDINADFNNVVDDTNWHFIAVRFDGTSAGHSAGNNYEVSFDGGAWQTWSSSSLPTGSNNSNTSMRLGNDGFSRNLEGNIDETSIWNKILTDAEITTIYNSGTGKTLDTAKGAGIWTWSNAYPTFSDDFSSSPNGWTLNHSGSGQSISGGALISSVSPSNGYKAFAIGDPTEFVLDLDWELTTLDTPVVILSSDTSGYGDPSEGNRRLLIIGSANSDGNLRFSNRYYKTGASRLEDNGTLVSGGTSASTGVKYFYRFVKSSTSMTFKRYLTASDRTSGANLQQETTATDTTPSGVANYSYIEVSGHGSSGTNKLYDFKFYSGVSSV